MKNHDIVAPLQNLSRSAAIEVVYLIGHQLAHPRLDIIDARIPTAALSEAELVEVRAVAHRIVETAEQAFGRGIAAFTARDRASVNNALRTHMYDHLIVSSATARRDAEKFLRSIAA